MHTSDPSAEGTSPAPGAESSALAAPPPEPPAARPPTASDATDASTARAPEATDTSEATDAEANGPAIELALETVELSDAEAAAVAAPSLGASPGIGDPAGTVPPALPEAASVEVPADRMASPLALPQVPGQASRFLAALPAGGYVPSRWFLGITAFVVAAADIGTKEWAKWALAGPDLKRSSKHIEAIPGHLDFIFAQNPGGAWSFLRSVPDGIRRPFFLFVSAAAIVFIVSVYGRLERRQWAMRWGLPLALGGAIGNLADRVRYGWVVDFIDAYYKGGANEVHWPTFNVADVAIVFGVGLMALDLLSLRHAHTDAAPPRPAETAGGAA